MPDQNRVRFFAISGPQIEAIANYVQNQPSAGPVANAIGVLNTLGSLPEINAAQFQPPEPAPKPAAKPAAKPPAGKPNTKAKGAKKKKASRRRPG